MTCAVLLPETSGARKRLIAIDSEGRIMSFSYPKGQHHYGDVRSVYDIDCYVEEPKTVKVWVNIYPSPANYDVYRSREHADALAGDGRIACKEITYTEGEGLSC